MAYSFKNNRGFSLLELVVGLGIFSVIVLSSTAIFQRIIDGQRMAIASQNTQESLRYTMEHISKEIRMALEDDGTCTGSAGSIFAVGADNSILYFKNQDGECVIYTSESNRFKITRGSNSGYITPDDIYVSNLKFYLKSTNQPAVTLTMRVNNLRFGGRDLYRSQMDAQTTISSRYYE